MKIGLKLFPFDIELINQFGDLFDFYEIMIFKDTDVSILKKYPFPMVIHAAHQEFDFDPGNPDLYESNVETLKNSIKAAKVCNADFIVVHPGTKTYEGSDKNIIEFFKKHHHPKFVYENIFQNSTYKFKPLFSTPEDMKRLITATNGKMLLDFSHAIVQANVLKIDPYLYIEEFMRLNPYAFHISGININSTEDQNEHLFDVDNDYSYLKHVQKNQKVTFETSLKEKGKLTTQEKSIQVLKDKGFY